ncbi:hypothetical protein SLEP1_g24145 [Rubroshorea leprosula]|uniref:Uncharacterized protein n=1 Tax=Rubroshorea leprosula TaxID=152421 RepID=A0AAV5JKN2_9ROSI|nr:hypothetical protein SLEP1_g24145 [Rubroshorea leprosula]
MHYMLFSLLANKCSTGCVTIFPVQLVDIILRFLVNPTR